MNRFDSANSVASGIASRAGRLPNDNNPVIGYRLLMWLMALLLIAGVAGCGGGSSGSAAPSSANDLTALSVAGVAGVVNETANTITVTVPFGTNVTALVATFTTTGASVKVGTVTQTSGTTPNDFTNPVLYSVIAANGSTEIYTITVVVAANFAKALTSFSVLGVAGAINEAAKTIMVIVPFGTHVTALAATFTTTGASVNVGTTVQASGITLNDYTNPVLYTVTAADNSTYNYLVTVTIAANSAKAITGYSFAAFTSAAVIINESAQTIGVTVPYGTVLTNIVATFMTTGTVVKVGTTVQTSGATANNFTNPVAYIVTAADGSTATYTVTVTVAPITAKAMTGFSFAGFVGAVGTIDEQAKTIDVTVEFGTNVMTLVATFTTTGTVVKVDTTVQTSGATINNYTIPVHYTVTAGDLTTVTYLVTVAVDTAAPQTQVNLLTAGNFAILANSAITYNGTAGAAAVTGDMGISPGLFAAITGFSSIAKDATNDFATAAEVVSPGKIYAPDFTGGQAGSNGLIPAKMTAAQNDMVTAYNDAAGRPAGAGTFLDAGTGGSIGGLSLPAGVYTWVSNANVTIPTNMILSGDATDVWIFQIPGTLVQASGAHVFLTGGALAKNVFWQVAGGVTLGTTSHMEGTILSATTITLATGASVNGRLLAQTAVTLGGTVTEPAP